MQTDVQEIYTKTILPLPDSEKLQIATLILEEISGKAAGKKSEAKGEARKIFGMWQGKEFTYEEYLQLDHNERIDFDLARSYADNHEDED
ncbi:MAG TPA: hypothetical protein VNI84_00035 [Pyrinomonadaceae bacterium]|nr:hypothetical protein [Pyrinomonadaceae bacterium]